MNSLDIEKENAPNHVAIIMDGNGRWAKKRFLPRTIGHKYGVERVRDILKAAKEIGVKYLTLYAFSTENWNRPKPEVDRLMELFSEYLSKELENLHQNRVKINMLGEFDRLPNKIVEKIKESIKKTENNKDIVLNIALNYGSRQEIIKGIIELIKDYKESDKDLNDLNEETFKQYLYTKGQPDPDLIIRTSGEQRISNFLLYQMAYSEFIFTETLWPDFDREEFFKCITKYQERNRRFGRV